MPNNSSTDPKDRRDVFEPDAPKPKNKKYTLFKHIMHALFSISIGTLIGVLAAPLAATTGIAILIGLGTAALALFLSETCTCKCTDDSASNNLQTSSNILVSNLGMDANTVINNNQANTISIELLLSKHRIKRRGPTTIVKPSLAAIAEDPQEEESEEAEEAEEAEEKIKLTRTAEEPEENMARPSLLCLKLTQ